MKIDIGIEEQDRERVAGELSALLADVGDSVAHPWVNGLTGGPFQPLMSPSSEM